MKKHMDHSNKAAALSVIFITVIVIGAMLFAASGDSGGYVITEPATFEDKLVVEQEKARQNFNLQFEHVDDAVVTLATSGDEVSMAYIIIQASDKISNSDMNSISGYIQSYFDYLPKEQIAITYVDSSFSVLKSVCSAP